jgi:hypothetical protein
MLLRLIPLGYGMQLVIGISFTRPTGPTGRMKILGVAYDVVHLSHVSLPFKLGDRLKELPERPFVACNAVKGFL